jgi:carbamoyl-phosphate synthase large subunit
MPRLEDIHSVMVIGSGPIVIGQGCEFDYSGTQAIRALREEGLRVVLINSNPATIMTDPEMADATYIEPLTFDACKAIIEKERPDVLLPTLGGQTALNLAMELSDSGVLEEFGVRLIGVDLKAIRRAEDRSQFKLLCDEAGFDTPRSVTVHTLEEATRSLDVLGLPAIIRPSFTLGGSGSGMARTREDFLRIVKYGLQKSPVREVLIEESVEGWKEFELEVMRDREGNHVVVCSIENLDPMGVHTGDSVTVAPVQTLRDREYQRMRDAAFKIMDMVGIWGGANVQFALEPGSERMVVIEMNPRVSRSSALASKATGFPIAKVAARLALGYTLHELPNDIVGTIPAAFEPSLDYVVVKIPRWNFEKFRGVEDVLGSQMQSIGEVMALGRTFNEALQKALRSLESDWAGLDSVEFAPDEIQRLLAVPNSMRLFAVKAAYVAGLTTERI